MSDLFDPEVLLSTVGRLEEGGVHLWVIYRVGSHSRTNDEARLLSEHERYRAQRFRSDRDRNLFVSGRYYTRILLAGYAGISPEQVTIGTDAFGKPFSDVGLHFSISHSRDLLLLGFSDTSIGVDIEQKDPLTAIERIGKNHFAEAEVQQLMIDEEAGRLDTFFNTWTKKESVIKGIGRGLHISLQGVNVANRDGCVRWEIPDGPSYGSWYVRGVETNPGYASAYATQNPASKLRTFHVEY
ncbi:MAG: 4'-phosphopantetheinyl transferase superfamily protein [Balneolaceae bacterium]